MATRRPPQNVRSSSWSALSPTSDFYYRPSGEIISGSFRVASILPGQHHDPIRCRLQEVSLKDSSARFLALSYCWNTSKAEETIFVDGQPVKITVNLYAALRNARASSTVVSLWVDQICVDQTNIIDRNDQVSKMGAIFRQAGGVIVWLGEADTDTASAMDLPKRIRRYWPSLYDRPDDLRIHSRTPPHIPKWGEKAWDAFLALLGRPWFKRLWVIQEIACARDIVVTCGSSTALWDDFVRLIYVVDATHNSFVGVNHMLGTKSAAQYVGFMQELRTVTEKGTKQAVKDYASEESMAPYVLRMAKDCNATDHRDKLYAFHHIIRLVTRPDYAIDIQTLYQQFALRYLQRIAYAMSEFSCDVVALSQRQLEFIYSAGLCNQRLELPSWCPDWSVPWQARPLWLDSKCYKAGGSEIKEITPLAESASAMNTAFRLPLTAKVFDRVFAAGTVGLSFSKGTLAETLREWLFSSMSLLHNNRSRPIIYADQHAAIARTITAEQEQGQKLTCEGAVAKYDALLDFLRRSDGEAHHDNSNTSNSNTDHYSTVSFLRGRIFFVTEKGRFGIARDGLAWGDSIAVVQGAPVPMLLRPTVKTGPLNREFQLLTDAFVLGVMDGEVWEDETIVSEEIFLV